MARLPIAVVMQRRTVRHRWTDIVWRAVGVVANPLGLSAASTIDASDDEASFLVPGIDLSLYPDENDGYFENWAAPEPKVFVMWRLDGERAWPVIASVSYGEGTRMLDSGECADGVPMPPDIHAWLGAYLQEHYRPAPRRGRQHG